MYSDSDINGLLYKGVYQKLLDPKMTIISTWINVLIVLKILISTLLLPAFLSNIQANDTHIVDIIDVMFRDLIIIHNPTFLK